MLVDSVVVPYNEVAIVDENRRSSQGRTHRGVSYFVSQKDMKRLVGHISVDTENKLSWLERFP